MPPVDILRNHGTVARVDRVAVSVQPNALVIRCLMNQVSLASVNDDGTVSAYLRKTHGMRAWVCIMIAFLCISCTAGSRPRMLSKFPATIQVSEILFFTTDRYRCTFAVVETGPSIIDPALIQESKHNLDALRKSGANDLQRKYVFPRDGFAYFEGKSVPTVASDMDVAGDEGLAWDIGDEFFSGRDCMQEFQNAHKKPTRDEYLKIDKDIRDEGGIVVIGEKFRHTTIVYFPERRLAYYFGP